VRVLSTSPRFPFRPPASSDPRFPRHLSLRILPRRAGRGEMTYVNGDVYEGEWVENAREGHGTYWKHEYGRHRAEYVGEWASRQAGGVRRFPRRARAEVRGRLGAFQASRPRAAKPRSRTPKTASTRPTGSNAGRTNPPAVDVYEGDWVEDRMTGEG
jgi:hypothetical protein